MFFADVTPLMRNGLRLLPGERTSMRVTVTILESDRGKNSSGRNIVEASLYVSYGTAQMSGRGRIIDPVVLPYKGAGFLLSGTELASEEVEGVRRYWEHRQVWLVEPVALGGGE